MARTNTQRVRANVSSPVVSEATSSGPTHQGGPGFARDTKSELFLLAVANFVGEDTFYEDAQGRDTRFADLVQRAAHEHPLWTARLLRWLRTEANMRTASIVGAAEYVKASSIHHAAGFYSASTPRSVVSSVIQRADEPGEMIAYWLAKYGRTMPSALKRGIGDAVLRLGTEFNYLKWDGEGRGVRFADVLNLTHPGDRKGSAQSIRGQWQHDLFRYAVKAPHQGDLEIPESLATLTRRKALMAMPVDERRRVLESPQVLAEAGMTWESLSGWLQGPMDKAAWEAIVPSMGYMACLAEGTPVWLADGTTAPIEEVVARRLPVLSYDHAWDTRPVQYGANQGPRDHSVGNLVPTMPTDWINTGVRPVAAIRFASGRVIEATYDHRWARQRRRGRQAWEWTTTADLAVGDRIPMPLTAGHFGDEGDAWDGYFVGAMLGDGGMTGVTPEFHGDPDDGAVAFMRDYADKHGCRVTEYPNGKIVRMRFPLRQWTRNPLTEVLRAYDVWGKRCEVKSLPQRPFSRDFWIGAVSGLIDTDGCVRERTNPKGTYHASVEYATVSRKLADQVADALLRLGVPSIVRTHALRASGGITGRYPLHVVEVSRAPAVVRLAELLDLRIGYKASTLARAAERLRHVQPAASEMHGYDPSVALDRIVAIEDAGERETYCVTVGPSNLFVANGIVTGNCLRNLRNFDQAGVSDVVAATVAAKLADPEQVARSRQLPMRFLSAYRAAPSLRWSYPLEQALGHSLRNIPELRGRTLILVDTSSSMDAPFSKDGTLMRWDSAVVFGLALASRCSAADVVSFSSTARYFGDPHGAHTKVFPVQAGESVLRGIERWKTGGYFLGGGTATEAALRQHFAGHDRVVILTDEQAGLSGDAVGTCLPRTTPLFSWNLAGHKMGHAASGSGHRHVFGGLQDAAFRMIPLLEAGRNGDWDSIFGVPSA